MLTVTPRVAPVGQVVTKTTLPEEILNLPRPNINEPRTNKQTPYQTHGKRQMHTKKYWNIFPPPPPQNKNKNKKKSWPKVSDGRSGLNNDTLLTRWAFLSAPSNHLWRNNMQSCPNMSGPLILDVLHLKKSASNHAAFPVTADSRCVSKAPHYVLWEGDFTETKNKTKQKQQQQQNQKQKTPPPKKKNNNKYNNKKRLFLCFVCSLFML